MQLKGIWGDITAEAANSRPTSEETRGKLNATRKPLNPSTANFGKEHAEFIDFFLFLFFVFDSTRLPPCPISIRGKYNG